jgi:hypothetical protein
VTAPEVPHSDLIADRLWDSKLPSLDHVETRMFTLQDLRRLATDALGNTVPREEYDEARRLLSTRVEASRLDEARAERDALAHVIEQAASVTSEMADTDEYPLEFFWRTRILRHLDTAPAVSLALHDAEVFDQGWKACQQLAHDQEPFTQVQCDNPYRAAAIRKEAN